MENKRCKLMFFVYIMGQGGAEKVILNILNSINRKKYDIYLTMGVKEGNVYLKNLKKPSEIHINYLDVALGNDELASEKLAFYLDDFNIDILFTEAYFTNTLAYQARKKQKSKKKVKLIFREATARSKTAYHSFKNGLKTFFVYNFIANKVIAISDGVKEDLKKSYGVWENKIVRIHNPIDIEMVESKSKEKIKDSEFVKIKTKKIINVARLAPSKNQKILLDAFKILSQKRDDVSLILLGKGELEEELKNYCKDNEIRNVYFLGFKENPYPYVKNSDVFVLSSKSEGFGNVITEAMVIGTPVVSTDCMSGPSEILENGKCGILVEVGNEKQLEEAIEKMLDHKKIRENFIKVSKKEVKNYKLEEVVKEYEKVIDTVYKK